MHTRVVPATTTNIAEGAKLLRRGETVAFPTETVYGLGANALDEQAVEHIFTAKERPRDNPLIVHIADLAMLDTIARDIPMVAHRLIDQFWPGPLSLVLPKHQAVPALTTAHHDTVVVRFPSHPVAQALISESGLPVAAPSANRSGNVSPTTAQHVEADLAGRIPLIIDGGRIEYGIESTVVDCVSQCLRILRPGSLTIEQLLEHVPDIVHASESSEAHSPGMKYRHYSPTAKLILFTGDSLRCQRAMQTWKETHEGLIVNIAHSFPADYHLPENLGEAAAKLYDTLRTVDTTNPTYILIEGYPEVGVGTAIMNRLRKAAKHEVRQETLIT